MSASGRSIVNRCLRNVFVSFALGSLLIGGVVWAPGVIMTFSASNQGDSVTLEWSSGSEAGLSVYQIERSLDGLDFSTIAEVSPQGDNSTYIYEDHDLFKGSTRTYYYRIRAAMSNGTSSLSSVQSVTLSFSGIQQTWGSIKALFR